MFDVTIVIVTTSHYEESKSIVRLAGQYKARDTGPTSIKHAPAVPAGPRLNHALALIVAYKVILNHSTAGRRDIFGLLESVLMNVLGLYVSCKFGGNVKLLMYDDL